MAANMLQCYALKQKESESCAEFLDRDMREYLAVLDIAIKVNNFIQLINAYGKISLIPAICSSQTIFTAPNMTLGRATDISTKLNSPTSPWPETEWLFPSAVEAAQVVSRKDAAARGLHACAGDS